MKKAVILLSGGLDSTATFFYALAKGFKAHALIFNYGQRHKKEIGRARKIAKLKKCPYRVIKLSLPASSSALLNKDIKLPERRKNIPREIPVTYVPARNIIFLSLAASWAETIGAQNIFIGANAIDYSGYPDCRPEFFKAYEEVLRKGLKTGVQGGAIKIHAPLLFKTKKEIVLLAKKLRVPFNMTWSCYKGGKRPCGVCDSCMLRKKGFREAGMEDS